MAVETQILSILDPTVKLEEFAIADDAGKPYEASMGKREKYQGDLVPSVMLKGYQFNHREIQSMQIDESGFLPRLTVTLLDRTGAITSAYFPRATPIISIYIRSRNDKLKPIRNDYLITSIRSTESDDHSQSSDGKGSIITVSGVLYLPQLFKSESSSIPSMTSHDALLEIARKNQLGFATNEVKTNDKMTWLAPFVKAIEFIQHITKHAYLNDDTCYVSFIDKYYHLNFVNINNMFSEEFVFNTAFTNIMSNNDYIKDEPTISQSSVNEGYNLFMTNLTAIKGSDQYIQTYRPVTQQGSDLLNEGYRKVLHYYDHFADHNDMPKKFIDLFLEPYKGTTVPTDPVLRQTSDDEWLGVDYRNTHPEYLFSKILNEHYIRELAKTRLFVRTMGVNLNVLRGSRVAVVIVKEGNTAITEYSAEVKNQPDTKDEDLELQKSKGIMVDRYLTGFYIVLNIKTIFDPTIEGKHAFYTEYELGKKVWSEIDDLKLDDSKKSK